MPANTPVVAPGAVWLVVIRTEGLLPRQRELLIEWVTDLTLSVEDQWDCAPIGVGAATAVHDAALQL